MIRPFLRWRVSLNTEREFQALCHAGLGEVEQDHITESMYRRAMAGEIVKRVAPRRIIKRDSANGICERCGKPRDSVRTYCSACRSVRLVGDPKPRAYVR